MIPWAAPAHKPRENHCSDFCRANEVSGLATFFPWHFRKESRTDFELEMLVARARVSDRGPTDAPGDARLLPTGERAGRPATIDRFGGILVRVSTVLLEPLPCSPSCRAHVDATGNII